MRAEFFNAAGEVTGIVIVEADGVARLQPGSRMRPGSLEGVNVYMPGPRFVRPEDGELYLRALPFTFRGNGYVAARFVPDD